MRLPQALARRIDDIVPFLPFTKNEQVVVADMELRHRMLEYRKPCVTKVPVGQEDKRRLLGNLKLRHTRSLTEYATTYYEEMQGASTMAKVATQADGLFIGKYSENKVRDSSSNHCLVGRSTF